MPASTVFLAHMKPQELGIPLGTQADCELGCCGGAGTCEGSSCDYRWQRLWPRTGFPDREGTVGGPVVHVLPVSVSSVAVLPWQGSL